jgi:hypothetical protein
MKGNHRAMSAIGRAVAAIVLMSALAGWGRLAAGQDYSKLPPPNLGPPPNPTAPPTAPPAPLPGATAPQAGSTAAAALPALPLPPVTISAEVDQPRVPQKERVNYIVTITWEQAATTEEYPLDFEFPDPPAAEGLVLIGNRFKAVTDLSGSAVKIIRTYTYEFYAEKIGATEIKPVAVKYFRIGTSSKSELKTQAIPLEVVRPSINVADVVRHPAAIVVLAVLALVVIVLVVRGTLVARRQAKAAAVPVRSPHEIARERLAAADRLRMAGDYVEFLRALAAEIRRYSEAALGVKAHGLSLSAIGPAVADRLGEEWKGRLDEFDKLSDKVKFAGYEPKTAELDAAMTTAKALVAEGEKKLTCEQS